MKYLIVLFHLLILLIPRTSLAENQDLKAKLLLAQITGVQQLAKQSRFIQAVKKQNNIGITMEEIHKRDKEWINSDDNTPLKISMSTTPIGKFLKNSIKNNNDKYNEIFLIDAQGANVAAYPTTSDYWQGDEDKFIQAFNDGKGDVFVGSIQFDESTQSNAVQISVPVQYNKKTIGVLVIGVKVNHIIADKLGSKK